MICPYICHVIQTNQNRYEYDEEGRNTFHEHILAEQKVPERTAALGAMAGAPMEVGRNADTPIPGERAGRYGRPLQ